jgi:hypothetical protein
VSLLGKCLKRRFHIVNVTSWLHSALSRAACCFDLQVGWPWAWWSSGQVFFLWRRKKNIYSCQKSDLLFNAQQLTKFADPSLPLNVNFCTVGLGAGRIHPHHHYMSIMELGHLLTRSGLTLLEVCSEVCHDSFCQLGNSVLLSWVVCREAFCLHVVSSSSCIPVFCLEPVLFLILC